MRQLSLGFQLYTGDHNERILPNRDGQNVPLGETWVQGWLGLPGPDCTNTLYLKQSLLGPYVRDPAVWRCPVRQTPHVAGVTMPRVRTISLNCFMGSPSNAVGVTCYSRSSEITRPAPSEALVFLEERVDTINDGSFALQWAFDKSTPANWYLRDKPAMVHKGGCNLAYADSHASWHQWKDSRTLSAPRDDAPMPANADVLWMQEHATWRDP